MRIAHNDVYTNERLFRFGLIEDPKCCNCDEVIENLRHRLTECRLAAESWRLLERVIDKLGMQPLVETNLESILGAGGELHTKLSVTLRAELVTRLMTKGSQTYHPNVLVKA